jgi:hypothetical protein
MICKLLGEIDGRVKRIQMMLSSTQEGEQVIRLEFNAKLTNKKLKVFIEEWSMLTWNVLCITSRLQNELQISVKSQEDRVIFNKLNMALVDLVNNSRLAFSKFDQLIYFIILKSRTQPTISAYGCNLRFAGQFPVRNNAHPSWSLSNTKIH